MSKYHNICHFLESLFTIHTTKEEWDRDAKIKFRCKEYHHENQLTSASFTNKKSKVPLKEFCVHCKHDIELKQKTDEYIQTVLTKTGHIVTSVDFTTRLVHYQCSHCMTMNQSHTHNLLHANKGRCSHCQNESFRLTYEEVQKTVEEHGMTLLLPKDGYTYNKQLLPLLCRCERPHQAVLSDIRRDKHCVECKKEKCKASCLEKYGVENPFQYEAFKEKSKATCMTKFGFTHAMRHPDIIRKSIQSAYHKIEYELPSGEMIQLMGYEPIALEELYREGFSEEQVELINVPTFMYTDEYNKEHTYIPDMYIPHLHQIIEVKSPFTLEQKKDHNDAKFKKVIHDGYSLRLMVYEKNGKRKVLDTIYKS